MQHTENTVYANHYSKPFKSTKPLKVDRFMEWILLLTLINK